MDTELISDATAGNLGKHALEKVTQPYEQRIHGSEVNRCWQYVLPPKKVVGF